MGINPIELLLSVKSTLGPQLAEASAQIESFGAKVGIAENEVAAGAGRMATAFSAMDIAALAGPMAAIVALGVAVGAVTSIASGTSEKLDELSKSAEQLNNLATRTGADQSGLMATRIQIQDMGIDAETLGTSLKFLQKHIGDNDAVLAKYGITATSSMGALMQIADLFERMPDGPIKTTAALELLGSRGGAQLIPFLSQGSASIEEFNAKLRDTGVVLDDLTITRLAKFDDAQDELHNRMEGLKTTLSVGLLPMFEAWVNVMNRGAEALNKLTTIKMPDWWEKAAAIARAFERIEGMKPGETRVGPMVDRYPAANNTNPLTGGAFGNYGPEYTHPTGGRAKQEKSYTGQYVGQFGPFNTPEAIEAAALDAAIRKMADEMAKGGNETERMRVAVQHHSQAAMEASRALVGAARDWVDGTRSIGSATKNMIEDILASIAQKKAADWIGTALEVGIGLFTGGASSGASGGLGGIKEGIKTLGTTVNITNVSALSAKDVIRSQKSATGEMNAAARNVALAGRLP